MKKVEIFAVESGFPSSIVLTIDILAAANRLRVAEDRPPAFDYWLAGSAADRFAGLAPPHRDGVQPIPDIVIVPGIGLFNPKAVEEGLASSSASDARRRLLLAHEEGKEIAASCTGVFLLASAGILDGRRATTAWWLAAYFSKLFPNVVLDREAMVVTDGHLTTAGAAMAQVDLVLTLVARHAGPTLADACSRYLLMDARRSQTSFISLDFLTAGDERLRRARAWAEARLGEEFTVDELAGIAGMSPRTFARRLAATTGLSPVRFLQRLRAERAIALLETTRLPVDEIAHRVGYADASTLRRVLRRHGGDSPRAFRDAAVAAFERVD